MRIFSINVIWLITLEGVGAANSTVDITNVLRRSQAGKRGKISLNQSLIYIHPFPPTVTPIFLFVPLQCGTKKNYSEV